MKYEKTDEKGGEEAVGAIFENFGDSIMAHNIEDDGDEEKLLALKRDPFSYHTEA